jgi:hypothetical protein
VREAAAQTCGAQDRDGVRRRLSRVRTTPEVQDAFGQQAVAGMTRDAQLDAALVVFKIHCADRLPDQTS